MKKEINIAPQNSIIFIMDITTGVIPNPELIRQSLVTATSSCVAIGTLCSIDGETTIILSDEDKVIQNNERLVFEGMLDTPSKLISVCTVLNKPVLKMNVRDIRSHIQLWANDVSEPDNIEIIVKYNCVGMGNTEK